MFDMLTYFSNLVYVNFIFLFNFLWFSVQKIYSDYFYYSQIIQDWESFSAHV